MEESRLRRGQILVYARDALLAICRELESERVPRRREDEGAGGCPDERGEDPGLGFSSGDGGKEANWDLFHVPTGVREGGRGF